MKQSRPNVERAKWLYSMRHSLAWVKRRQGDKGNLFSAEMLKKLQ